MLIQAVMVKSRRMISTGVIYLTFKRGFFMKKCFFSVLASMVFFLICCSDSSDNSSVQLLTISSPEDEQVMYSDSVEILISLNGYAEISTLQAWLNGKDITDRFKYAEDEFRALIRPDDGLMVNTEGVVTDRDDKGVWFVRRSKDAEEGAQKNSLVACIGGEGLSLNRDEIGFTVDRRLFDSFDSMGHAVATNRLW
jgi:hypothetical protein